MATAALWSSPRKLVHCRIAAATALHENRHRVAFAVDCHPLALVDWFRYAPLPPPKAKNVLKTLTEARDFLAKGI
jgi:hypothetical protein